MEEEDMKYCKICLVTDCKMFSSPSISEAYSQLVQVVFCADYKLYVCYECKHLLSKCQEFRSKCLMALKLLSSIRIDHSKIPTSIVRGIDRKHFKLESKISRSSMLLVCNSNQQIVIPVINLDSDIEIDTNPEALEDDKSETKFAIDAESNNLCSDSYIKIEINTDSDALGDDKPEKKFKTDTEVVFFDVETHDTEYRNEIIQSSHGTNNIVPEIKSEHKRQLKSKKTKENIPRKIKNLKRVPKKRNLNVLPLSVSSILSRAPSQNMMQMFKEYAIVDVMTPSEAKKEMLLKKESKNYKMNVLTCELCYKGFTMESTYNNHMMQHRPDSGTEKCDFCHLLFPTRRVLSGHIEGCHKFKISCKLCPYVCFNPRQAKNHIAAMHKGETYTCELCKISFRYPHSLINHKRIKHPEHPCAHCGRMFASLMGLKSHKHRAHKQGSTELLGPKCEECDVQFATETAWKRHLVISSKHTVSNGCEECGETFFTTDELRSHAKEHPQRLARAQYVKLQKLRTKRPTVCKLCNKRLESDYEYKEHVKSEHPNTEAANKIGRRRQVEEESPYVCEVCGKVFRTSRFLNYHARSHTGERPYGCEQCGKRYPTLSGLSAHNTIHHTGAPRFKCDICQKDFHMKSAIRKHITLVHLGVRRFKCDICNKSFGHRYEVRMHREYVHFKKPWPKRDRTQAKRRSKEDKDTVE